MFTGTESKEETLFQNLENCTPEQLARLKKSFWFNKEKCPDELIESMKYDMLQKANKPCLFERRHYALDPLLLFEQFARFCEKLAAPPKKRQQPPTPPEILHNFRKRSPVYSQLFRWSPYETVNRIFQPVHYHIYVKGGRQVGRDNPHAIRSLADLQNVMIHSHRGKINLNCVQLVESLELFLYAVLSQVLVRGRRVLFLFEWSEAPRFSYVVCLDLVTQGEEDPITDTSILHMARNDLFEGVAGSPDTEMSDSDRRRLLVRESQPRYLFNAFVRRDSD
jgi:hypothetical protein